MLPLPVLFMVGCERHRHADAMAKSVLDLVPPSLGPYLAPITALVGLAGVEFGDHQRFTLKWAVLVCLLMLIAALACAVFPLYGSAR